MSNHSRINTHSSQQLTFLVFVITGKGRNFSLILKSNHYFLLKRDIIFKTHSKQQANLLQLFRFKTNRFSIITVTSHICSNLGKRTTATSKAILPHAFKRFSSSRLQTKKFDELRGLLLLVIMVSHCLMPELGFWFIARIF